MMKKTKKSTRIVILAILLAVVCFVVGSLIAQKLSGGLSREVSIEEAQSIVDSSLAALPKNIAAGAKLLAENTTVTVNSVKEGDAKNLLLECTYQTKNVKQAVTNHVDEYMLDAYTLYLENEKQGKKTNATKVKLFVTERIEADIASAEIITGETQLQIFETAEGVFTLYLADNVVNTIFGGILDALDTIERTNTVTYAGEVVSITGKNTLRSGVKDCLALNHYQSKMPDTSVWLIRSWNDFKYEFHRNFVVDDQWMYIVKGLFTTLALTLCSVVIGILLGFLVAVVRVTNQKTGKLGFLSGVCQVYLAIIRGTPIMVQLLIVYFVVLLPMGVGKFASAVICFGLNSGAYVSEIVRGGIMSVDNGQTEAGRSLGFTYVQTMFYIVIPQAFKAVLPSLANEFITLLKETSVAFYIGVADLTLGGIKIRSITYSNFMPLIAVALVYLVVVLGLSKCVSILERRLRKGDNR